MTKNKLNLYRKRMIPEEIIHLKDDVILHHDSSLIITNNTSKLIFDSHQKLVYWYCDIIETSYSETEHAYTFTDLLADVVIYPDKSLRVLDLDEIGDALEEKIISKETAVKALRLCNKLLEIIYSGKFKHYQNIVNKYVDK